MYIRPPCKHKPSSCMCIVSICKHIRLSFFLFISFMSPLFSDEGENSFSHSSSQVKSFSGLLASGVELVSPTKPVMNRACSSTRLCSVMKEFSLHSFVRSQFSSRSDISSLRPNYCFLRVTRIWTVFKRSRAPNRSVMQNSHSLEMLTLSLNT